MRHWLLVLLVLGAAYTALGNWHAIQQRIVSLATGVASFPAERQWLLFAAGAFFALGHALRFRNARTLVSAVVPTGWMPIIRSTSIGYMFNTLLPLKLGELVRAVVLGDELKVGRGTMLLTVVLERVFDCLVLSALALGLLWGHVALTDKATLAWRLSLLPLGLLGVGLLLLALFLVVYTQNRPMLHAGYVFSSVFNEIIKDNVRFKIWSAIHGVHTLVRNTNFRRYTLGVVAMWAAYVLGCFCLTAGYAYEPFTQLVISVLAHVSSSIQFGPEGVGSFNAAYQVFVSELASRIPAQAMQALPDMLLGAQLLPFALLGLAFFALPARQTATETGVPNDLRKDKVQRRTDVSKDFSRFLEQYFSGTALFQIINQLELKKGFHLLQTFHGGSHATTVLVADRDGASFVRKITLTAYADKLRAQTDWLRTYKHLPAVPEVLGEYTDENCYYYDVRFYGRARTFFDFIHSNPVEASERVLDQVLSFLFDNVYVERKPVYAPEVVKSYIQQKTIDKVRDTARLQLSFSPLLASERLTINGVSYINLLPIVAAIQDHPDAMRDLATYDETPVHGDLTVDNLLVDGDGFILLDPNNENAISSMAVDFAKLYQSLHAGYEFLRDLTRVRTSSDSIDFEEHISSKYHSLFAYLDQRLKAELPPAVYRSLLFHEAVHYCRMLTYRVNINPDTVPAFYAVAVRLFNAFYAQYVPRPMTLPVRDAEDASPERTNRAAVHA